MKNRKIKKEKKLFHIILINIIISIYLTMKSILNKIIVYFLTPKVMADYIFNPLNKNIY
jgi:hypothetical protein